MRQWSPGLTVVGTLVSDGRRKVFTIYPDGSTEEQEETAASSVFNYLRTTTTLPGGGSWHTIQLTTSLGARPEINEAVHSYGGLVFHDVINNKFARKAVEKGADGLVLVAWGAGVPEISSLPPAVSPLQPSGPLTETETERYRTLGNL